MQDVRFGLRMLRKNPGFTAVAVVTLALGIGANTAIFSVLYAVLLRPLPFPQPEQLVQLGAGLERGQPSGYVTGPQFLFCQDHAASIFDPLTRQANMPVQVFGMDDDEHSFGGTEIRAISEDYFQTMRMPVLEGRAFLQTDGAGSLPVALVNETLARRWWKGRNPIGQRIVIGSYKGRKLFSGPEIAPREIVGVVSDVKGMLLTRPAPPMVYIPATQKGDMLSSSTAWVVRTVGRIDIMPSLRRALAELNPEQRVTEMRSMREVIAASIAGQSFISLLLGVFAGVALVLAAVGIYGVLSLVVAQRTHEIGIRMALGAERRQVLKLVVGQGLMLALAGTGIGLVIALGLSGFLSSLLYQIRPTNFLPYLVATTVSIVMALLASYVPARRASRVDPMVALRYE